MRHEPHLMSLSDLDKSDLLIQVEARWRCGSKSVLCLARGKADGICQVLYWYEYYGFFEWTHLCKHWHWFHGTSISFLKNVLCWLLSEFFSHAFVLPRLELYPLSQTTPSEWGQAPSISQPHIQPHIFWPSSDLCTPWINNNRMVGTECVTFFPTQVPDCVKQP